MAGRKSIKLTKVKGDEKVYVTSWSPNGKQIAFSLLKQKETKLFVIEVASRQIQEITLSGGIDCALEPSWAPDGKSLLVHDCNKTQQGLALIDTGGKLIRRLTQPDPGTSDHLPVWSPDGKQIAFVSSRGGKGKRDEPARTSVFVMNADGTDLRALVTHKELSMSFPSWSSDGTLLACEAWKPITVWVSGERREAREPKVIVVRVADGSLRASFPENTAQPSLVPTGK